MISIDNLKTEPILEQVPAVTGLLSECQPILSNVPDMSGTVKAAELAAMIRGISPAILDGQLRDYPPSMLRVNDRYDGVLWSTSKPQGKPTYSRKGKKAKQRRNRK